MQLSPIIGTSRPVPASGADAPVDRTMPYGDGTTMPQPSRQVPQRGFGLASAQLVQPGAISGALEGVAALPPIIDLTDVRKGDQFDLLDGSTAGSFGGIKGTAQITAWAPDHATFHIEAKKLFFKVNVDVDIKQVDATHVQLSSRGTGIPDTTINAHVVESRTDFAKFAQDDDPSKMTTIQQDTPGHAIIDADVQGVGQTHLLLQRRPR